jgi:hypothetical protein
MSLRPLFPWLLMALALSVAAMVLGAGRGDRLVPALAAGLLSAAVVASALWINALLWLSRPGTIEEGTVQATMACNVRLAALVYAWGACALFAVYTLSNLEWRHAWQYGLGAALIAGGLALYGLRLERGAGLPPLYLTLLHGAAAGAGLLYLVGTGKLATLRSDWVANDVFLAGGLAVVALCVIAAITQTRGATRHS